MTNFLSQITTWFQPQPKKRLRLKLTKIWPKTFLNQAKVPPFNSQHYRQLIGKLAKIAIATQRERQRRRNE